MPLDVSVPTRMPAAAIQSMTRRGATFDPRAELRKLTASLATPTTMPITASRPMTMTMLVNRGLIWSFVVCFSAVPFWRSAVCFRPALHPFSGGGFRPPFPAEIAALRCGAGLSGAKERNGCYKRVTDGLRLYECLRRVKVNSSPPRSELRTEIVPPCIITAFLTIASPSPVPPSLRERPLSMR